MKKAQICIIKVEGHVISEPWSRRNAFVLDGELTKAHIFTVPKALKFIEENKIGEIFTITLSLPRSHLSESDWISQLREIFDAKVSIPFDSFEVNWKSLYQSGWTPEEAAESAIEGLEAE